MEKDFYKSWTDNLRSREKQKCNLQHEAFQLRERTTSLLIQLQDLVHPKKWITLAEARERILSEAHNLKEINTQIHYDYNLDCKKVLEVDLDGIESVIKQTDKFLEENKIDSSANLL